MTAPSGARARAAALRALVVGVLLVAAAIGWYQHDSPSELADRPGRGDSALARAFAERQNGVQAEGQGVVTRILPDDRDGSRHQRFIVRLSSGQTLVIAHNIDLAARLSSLREGDTVAFNGEYEWNARGGVIHWTHRDPAGRHVAGWLKHNGHTYQ